MADSHPTAEIVLLSGDISVLDTEDARRLSAWQWSLHDGYAARRHVVGGKLVRVFMHRAIMDVPVGMEVDHINRNRLDNRRENLRIVAGWFNAQNCRPGVSGVRGVTFHRQTGKWNARIRVNGRAISLGLFESIPEAASAGLYAEKIYGREGDRLPYDVTPIGIRSRANNKYGMIGVSFNRNRGRWEAWVTVGKKKVHLGMFDTIEAAAAARLNAENEKPWLAVLQEPK